MTIALESATHPGPAGRSAPHIAAPVRPRRGALRMIAWITLGLSSLLWVVYVLALGVKAGPAGLALCTGLAVVPVPVVLAAFRWIDRAEPEPTRLLVAAFLWGATTACFLSMVVETVVRLPLWLSAGIFEEIAKGALLVVLIWFVRSEFDGVTDGIVYGGFVAAGFAFSENIGYFVSSYVYGATADWASAHAVPGEYHTHDLFVNFLLRGLASPFAHPLFTVMFGIGLGLAVSSAKRGVRVIAPFVGLTAAIGLHGLWDYTLLSLRTPTVLFWFIGVAVLLFFVMSVVVGQIRRRELRSIGGHLQGYANQGWFAQSELYSLSTFKGRRQARRWAASISGAHGKRAMVDLQHAATKLGLLHRKLAAGRTVADFDVRQRALLVQLAGARTVLVLWQSF